MPDGSDVDPIAIARDELRRRQSRDGSWDGTDEFDPSHTALYLLLLRWLGQEAAGMESGLTRYLLATQLGDGGWGASPDGPALADTTLLCHAALSAAGVPAASPAMEAATAAVRRLGGPAAASPFARLVLVLCGGVPRGAGVYVSPRVVTLIERRRGCPDTLRAQALAVVPMSLLARPGAARRVLPETGPWDPVTMPRRWGPPGPGPAGARVRMVWWLIRVAARVAHAVDRLVPPAVAEARALSWVRERQGPDGTFCEMLPATALGLMALDACGGEAAAPAVDRGLATLRRWLVREDRGHRQRFTPSRTHTSARVLDALLAAGCSPDDPAIRAAERWLLAGQATVPGDWVHGARPGTRPGGWPFGRQAAACADVDTTAIVLTALRPLRSRHGTARDRAVDWILAMQDRTGGWAGYTANLRISCMAAPPPLCRALRRTFEPNEDVTARALMALAPHGAYGPSGGPPGPGAGGGPAPAPDAARAARVAGAMRRGVEFLWRRRGENGSWYGRWVAHYAYGTAQVIEALEACGVPADDPRLEDSARWLEGIQNPDGGWGEHRDSDRAGRFVPGPSSPVITAFVLLALVAVRGARSSSVGRGVDYLTAARDADGMWTDSAWTGVLAPGFGYIRYDLATTALVVAALARVRAQPPDVSAGPAAAPPPASRR